MQKRMITQAIASFVLCLSPALEAAIIFANPLVNTLSGYASNDPPPGVSSTQQMADDVILTSPEKLVSALWYGNYVNDQFGAGYTSDFTIRLFDDDGSGSAPVNTAPFFSEEVTAASGDRYYKY